MLIMSVMSCSNEFDVIDDFKEIPVVYGLLDSDSPYQYIRIERAFSDEKISALELASNPDTLYYKNLTVTITNKKSGEVFTLEEVDGNTIGIPRDTNGIFATAPNLLYRIETSKLNPNFTDNFVLDAYRGDEHLLSSSTKFVKQPYIKTPSSAEADINIVYKNFTVEYAFKDNAFIADAYFDVNVIDFFADQSTEFKTIRIYVTKATDKTVLRYDGVNFYTSIAAALKNQEVEFRQLVSVDLTVLTGGQSISDYIRVGQANSGITSSGETPVFSNIENGVGVFSSISKLTNSYGLKQAALDSLRNGIYTKDLKFK